jgi:hypothetical protein
VKKLEHVPLSLTERITTPQHENNKHFQCREVQIFENDTNKSKLHARRNYEHIHFGKCLFLFCPLLPKNIQFPIHKNPNFVCCLYGSETSLSHAKGGIREHGAAENM